MQAHGTATVKNDRWLKNVYLSFSFLPSPGWGECCSSFLPHGESRFTPCFPLRLNDLGGLGSLFQVNGESGFNFWLVVSKPGSLFSFCLPDRSSRLT